MFQRGRKRKGRNGATGKERKLQRIETVRMTTSLVEELIGRVSIQHDCGYNPACPAWYCCTICDRMNVMKEIDDLSDLINKLELSEEKVEKNTNIIIKVSSTEHEALDTLEAPKPVPSPVRGMIRIFESLNVDENVADKPVAKPNQGLSNCIKLGQTK